MEIQSVRRKLSYVCLAVGIVIMIVTHVYNTKFAYRYEYIPIQYEKYEKDLGVNTYAEMNIYRAMPIAETQYEMYEYEKYGYSIPKFRSIRGGVYYYVIDERETEGIVFLPIVKIEDGDTDTDPYSYRLEPFLGLVGDNYEIDTPLQVYGSIGEPPGFEDLQKNDEMEELISEYAILSADSLTPLNEEVRVGERISDNWIGIGFLFLIAFCILRPRKNENMDPY